MTNHRFETATLKPLCLLLLAINCALFTPAATSAQDVAARISSRESWVGSPIVLQLQVRNAENYSLPEDFEIDGCDVRSAGTPSQSSQITIINGRRSESRSVTMQYAITPRREGQFQIPALEIKVDGQTKKTRAMSFVATKSETGDLLFVEVESKKETVFVGQPLDLKLKIWVKPFVDRENKVKLNEGHMWQMLSEQTSWGAFTDRMKELAENRQRPGGETVLRKDEDGQQREYYLYEIEGTVYPTKPGKIDASDLQIVIDYPRSLGRRRDPFDSIFSGSGFGRSSLIEEMMGDDFFSSSFGRRLSVTESRPISAEANVNSTEVLPVPVANQPADYRGAVGRYQIVAEAEPKNVTAGDPITLRLGVLGDGPMELVQAPPLHEISSLVSDFQVTDQSLAGFVQDDTKVFITTIRPRSESVTHIPAIPFSFFDPDKREYQTVYTQPIDIEVEKAESLQLDAIVSKSGGVESSMDDKQQSNLAIAPSFDLQNDYTENVLRQESSSSRNGWWYFAAIPAGCWLMLVVGKLAFAFTAAVGKFRSPISDAKEKIRQAKTGEEVATALRDFVAALTKSDDLTKQSAVGQIREHGDYETANQIESLFHRVDRMGTSATHWNESQAPTTVEELKDECRALLEYVERSYNNRRKSSRKPSSRSRKRKLTATSLLLVLFSLPGIAQAQNNETDWQLQLLAQANEAYRTASELSESDPAESNQQFRVAAENYQRLVGDGVRNSELFFNLGNAWNQSGEPANAILNYHRSLILNPGLEKARRNLELLQQGIATDNEDKQSAQVGLASLLSAENAKSILTKAVGWMGWSTMTIIFAAASLIFWALVCLKTIKRSTPTIRWAIAPFVLTCVFGLALYTNQTAHSDLAIVTCDTIELRRGDGEEFAVDAKLRSCSGQEVRITDVRHNWFKVELPSGMSGWIPGKDLEQVSL